MPHMNIKFWFGLYQTNCTVHGDTLLRTNFIIIHITILYYLYWNVSLVNNTKKKVPEHESPHFAHTICVRERLLCNFFSIIFLIRNISNILRRLNGCLVARVLLWESKFFDYYSNVKWFIYATKVARPKIYLLIALFILLICVEYPKWRRCYGFSRSVNHAVGVY